MTKETGLISLLVVTQTGDTVETGREGAVGLHGNFGKRFSFIRAVTQIGGRFSVIGAARFAELVNGTAAVHNLISRYTEVQWAEAQQIAACNAVHDGVSRLTRYLLQSADRVGRGRAAAHPRYSRPAGCVPDHGHAAGENT